MRAWLVRIALVLVAALLALLAACAYHELEADPGDATYIDRATCLEWLEPGVGYADYQGAAAFCLGIGWRLPSLDEALTLLVGCYDEAVCVDESAYTRDLIWREEHYGCDSRWEVVYAVAPVGRGRYWTSTGAWWARSQWIMDYTTGNAWHMTPSEDDGSVLCVRDVAQ